MPPSRHLRLSCVGREIITANPIPVMKPSPLRIGFVLCALILIWGVWRPVIRLLPEDMTAVADGSALAALPEERTFLLSGAVRPAEGVSVAGLWHGRFAYVHRERRDLSRSGGKHTAVVTVTDARPAVFFDWAGGTLRLPADSYDLSRAPLAREDGADVSSTGFRAGDPALALGRVDASGTPRVEHLMETPIEAVIRRLERGNRIRIILTLAAKIGFSIFAVSLLIRIRPTTPRAKT